MKVTRTILKKVYKKRSPQSYKGQFGRLLIVGGSRIYSGAPGLNAMAAYRAGCDLVTVAAPERAASIIASFSPDIITYPLDGHYLTKQHAGDILALSEKSTALVIGGGLTKHKDTLNTVKQIIENITIPCVIDADAISAIDKKLKGSFIITPHQKEFYRLTGNKPEKRIKERTEQAEKTADLFGCVVLLKGHVDIITNGLKTFTNKTGNAFMTKGGTGDTLAGVAGALLSKKIDPFTAAAAAAFINGKAGDLAAKRLGVGMLATDLIDEIPQALKQ